MIIKTQHRESKTLNYCCLLSIPIVKIAGKKKRRDLYDCTTEDTVKGIK